jgi:hypothetical protein
MTNYTSAFERECDAARDRWEKLGGEEIAEVIDNLGDGAEVIQKMLFLARKNFMSDAYEVLHSLYILARVDTAQEWRGFIAANNPILLSVFDKYAKRAVEEMKINEAWIEGEADAELNFPGSPNPDREFDEARDDGRI